MTNTVSIKNDKLFNKLVNKGNWYGADYLILYVLPNKLSYNQIGLGVSKKVGKAYKRNYVKRLIREAYKNCELSLKFGFDLFFVCKSKANFDGINYDLINKDISQLLLKAGLIIWNLY